MPTAATADQAVRQSKRSPDSSAGSGACEWPQVSQTSPSACVAVMARARERADHALHGVMRDHARAMIVR